MLHAQFESIHPFVGGNGRLGRLLITLFLIERQRLTRPLLYLSAFLEGHRDEYYALLQRVRTHDEWTPWLTFFAVGVHETAERATRQARALIRHYERDREKVKGHALRAGRRALPHAGHDRARRRKRMLEVTDPTARRAVRELEARGLLEEWGEKRWPRVYLARHVLDAVLHPLEDLRSGPGAAEPDTVVKSEAAQAQQTPLRRADRLMAEAMDIIDAARDQGAQLRLTGGLAVRRYCTDLDFMDREYSDIDFVGLADQKKEIHDGLRARSATRRTATSPSPPTPGQLQYIKIEALEGMKAEAQAAAAGPASTYEPPLVDHIDIFLDVMRMDHDIDVQRAARDRRLRHLAGRRVHRQDADRQDQPEGRARRDRPGQGRAAARRRRRRLASTCSTSPRCAPTTGGCTRTSPPTSTSPWRWSTTTG